MKRTLISLLAAALLLLVVAAPARAQQTIADAKDLYASAAYDEALVVLDRVKAAGPAPAALRDVEQYRALCLLALKRQADAERAIEALVGIDPFYRPLETEAAPWVRASFAEVRRRMLPGAAQQQYLEAKAAFGKKDYARASAILERVLGMLEDPDLGPIDDRPTLVDLRTLAQGFLELSQSATAKAAAAPGDGSTATKTDQAAAPRTDSPAVQKADPPVPPVPGASAATRTEAPKTTPAKTETAKSGTETSTSPKPVEPPPPAGRPLAGPPAPGAAPPEELLRIYSVVDTDVIPPKPVFQRLPSWPQEMRKFVPATAGQIELVIDEAGLVVSATIRVSLNRVYDALLVEAAKTWRYTPAMFSGKPVKYRRLIEVRGPTGTGAPQG